jgi:hypothetical protein
MSPHGSGMIGATHSHNPEYPDDEWNLYTQLDVDATNALNVTQPQNVVGIFKPHALRLTNTPVLFSDADSEIIINAIFVSPVHIRKLCIIGGGETANHPNVVRCFVNKDRVDFTEINDIIPAQEFILPINNDGNIEFMTSIHAFTNVTSLTFYFPSNHGDEDVTAIQYIGMQGEHTHFRREAVNTIYEVLCTGEDIEHSNSTGVEHHLH